MFEIMILPHTKDKPKILRWLPLILMELFPLIVGIHSFITKPSSFIFDWKDDIVLALWTAGAILAGGLSAWVVYLKSEKR